jgi:hypothetical protein
VVQAEQNFLVALLLVLPVARERDVGHGDGLEHRLDAGDLGGGGCADEGKSGDELRDHLEARLVMSDPNDRRRSLDGQTQANQANGGTASRRQMLRVLVGIDSIREIKTPQLDIARI